VNIVSINSHVAYGYVGNDAAAFCLRRLGVEAWQVDSVVLSNHPGYGACTGRVTPVAELTALLDGMERRGGLSGCAGVLAGYLGAAEQAEAVRGAFARVRAATPAALCVLDPVMGDHEPGLYVKRETAAAIIDTLVPHADVITPNAFELGEIAGTKVNSPKDALAAAKSVLERGPGVVLVTSIPGAQERIDLLAVTKAEAWSLSVSKLRFAVAPNGAGDALAGLFAGHLVLGRPVPEALERSANAVHAVLEATQAAGRRELALIAAQDVITQTPERFPVRALHALPPETKRP